jgi:hypothetical protein
MPAEPIPNRSRFYSPASLPGAPLAVAVTILLLLGVFAAASAEPQKVPERPSRSSGDARQEVRPQDVPDIYGPGAVSTVGNVWIKTTNIGIIGNPFTALSSDPSAQWPGASGNEHLFFIGLWIGAKDPNVTDPALLRRVSHNLEWRPPSLAPEDRIYQSFDGQVNGARFSDDDGDDLIDEDRLDGHDNDDDGLIDEDYAAISQQMFTCIIRDDTPEALDAAFNERHVQRNLEVQQNTYAFSVPGANDFTSFEFIIENVGTSTMDSVYVAFQADQDVGPVNRDRYFADDLAEPRFPHGPDLSLTQYDFDDPNNPNAPFLEEVALNDPRYQSGLCTRDTIYVHGFSVIDDDGDEGLTASASSFVLLGHTTDPTGQKAPRRVGLHMYYWYTLGIPFNQGGQPTDDLERYQVISSTRGIDQETGYINFEPPDAGSAFDYRALCSVGPFLDFRPGEKITVSFALAVQSVDYTIDLNDIDRRYENCTENAIAAVQTYRGSYEVRQGLPAPAEDGFGQETPVYADPGEILRLADCHDDSSGATREVKGDDIEPTWFDFDCNYCTGVAGQVLKRWVASSPPPNPQMETEPGNRAITLRWDNRSEYTPDPAKGFYDFKGYKIWKAANWTRPVGSTGPSDDLWSLLGTYYWYDEIHPFIECDSLDVNGDCVEDEFGEPYLREIPNVLVNRQTGERIFPNDIMCMEVAPGICDTVFADKPTRGIFGQDTTLTGYPVVKYPIGRYEWSDENVLNGFVYFYAITAFDSTGKGSGVAKLEGRPAAVEGDAQLPQSSMASGEVNDGKIYVVPNPYRGRAEWDLTPSAGDPTGTHVDFYNMPPGPWVMRIYTVSGDLVQEIRSTDIQLNGKPQQETPDDGQASWNLISRNGQEVVSGIYMFSVEAGGDTQQGKLVVIR